MTTRYVDSNASGTPTAPYDGGWSTAAASLYAVSGSCSTGDVILVDDGHDYDAPSTEVASFPANISIISVDKADNSYSPGAKEMSSTAGVDPSYEFALAAHIRGLTLGNDSASSGFPKITFRTSSPGDYNSFLWAEDCTFEACGGDYVYIYVGYYGGIGKFSNCTFSQNGYSSAWKLVNVNYLNDFYFYSCQFLHPQDTDTDWAIFLAGANGLYPYFEDCDLSKFQYIMSTGRNCMAVLKRCQIHSDLLAVQDTSSGENVGSRLQCYDCSAVADTNQTTSQLTKVVTGFGSVINQDDTVFRNASDGESSFSWKITPTNTYGGSKYFPAETLTPMGIWHPADGSKTLTISLGSGDSNLLDDEVWAEVTHVSSNATTPPMHTRITTRGDGAAADTSTYLKTTSGEWSGTGPSSEYEIVVTGINPAEPGPIYVRVFYGYVDGNSVWVDPKLTLTAE